MEKHTLTVDGLSKTYKKEGLFSKGKEVRALNSVSFSLVPGFYGLLGPNGAGKSTLMGIITGNVRADAGSVLWDGADAQKLKKEYRRILGYVPQQQTLYENYTGRRFLLYMAALKDMPSSLSRDRAEACAAEVGLTEHLDKRISSYSGGMKQRLLTAAALLDKPKLLILDEPMAGLDPKERVHVRSILADLSRESIILMATHVVSDIESACDEVLILKQGELIEKAPVRTLTVSYGVKDLEEVYMSVFGGEER